ncbi:MAG: hypothetical protein LBV36_00845 [Chromatiales bacterium]|jgi:hypothetical protein|nr:hypothetical protein [Chromatiales bacterium]
MVVFTRKSHFTLMLVALLCIALIGAYYSYRYFHAKDLCSAGVDREVLYSAYPSLRELSERQQQETERLLARQRAEDIAINQGIGEAGSLSPEEVLRMSVNQVSEIAALRREHRIAFEAQCRALARR